MKSLRWRLAFWFGGGVLLVTLVFFGFTYRYLEQELRQKNWQRDYPEHPDWVIHGSYSQAEVQDILHELILTSLVYSIPLLVLAIIIGHLLARKSLKPITELNAQLRNIAAPQLSARLHLAEADPDFQALVLQINDLLGRLEKSFNDMSEYAAKVAHELRTPLAILRLKVEQAGDKLSPELAEELQSELHQLAHVVGQSLLMAKAEQGRLVTNPAVFDLAAVTQEAVHDFSLLAEEQGRLVDLRAAVCRRVRADSGHVRQIVHNLLTNALKHGKGVIRVKVCPQGRRVVLTISNEVRQPETPAVDTLGLGLRVVETLASLQPDLQFRQRRTDRVHAARLAFGPKQDPAALQPGRESLPPAFKVGT